MKIKCVILPIFLFSFAALLAYPQSITVTSPAAGDLWCPGSTHTITWSISGTMSDTVKIRLRRSGAPETEASVWDITDSTPNDGSFGTAAVPASVPAGDYFIRVRTTGAPDVIGDSPAFEIGSSSASIAVTEPPPTAVFRARNSMRIAWTSSCINGNVRIELEKHGTAELYLVSASHPYNRSPLEYLVPDAVPEGSYRVKISQGAVVGYSGWIGILAWVAPSLSLVSPNGGETLTQGSYYTIEWDAQNLDGNVRIDLLRGGALEMVLAESHFVNTGFFTWRNILSSSGGAKHMTGTNFKIRIRTLDFRFTDVSETEFSIQAPPGIWVVKPAAAEVWDEDSTQVIRWNAQKLEGFVGEIILDFPSGSPLRRLVIAEGFSPMDKSYSWRVMDHVGGTRNLPRGTYPGAVIIVRATRAGSSYSASSKEFTIRKR